MTTDRATAATLTGPLLADVPLSRSGLDRRGDLRADPTLLARLLDDPQTRVLAVADQQVPIDRTTTDVRLRWRAPNPGDIGRLAVYLGRAGGLDHVAVYGEPSPLSGEDDDWVGLRAIGADLDPVDAGAVTAALGVGNWHTAHRFCPRCGRPTRANNAGWTRHCDNDGSEHFPRTDPAVIMAVLDADDRLLLARNPTWPEGRLSVLAGFVEPGETLAEAVRREVAEEVGLDVPEVRYLGDQPWPFPGSLMIGFEARAAGTELTLQPEEIAEAHWVTRDEYRERVDSGEWVTGTNLSISRRLVLRWLDAG